MKTALIGAGLAGTAAARALKEAGIVVSVFDKGRGPGGRLSTRRIETALGQVRMDHGAQYVTAQSDSFLNFLAQATEAGACEPWKARLFSIDRGGNAHVLRPVDRFVGRAGMSSIVKFALEGLNPEFNRRAKKLTGEAGAWRIHFEDGTIEGPFDAVGVTLPPEQLIEFLARSDGDFATIIATARRVTVAPCWAVMAVADSAFDPGFDGAKVYGGSIRWISRMASRPGFGDSESVVIQASPDWSNAFLEETPDFVAQQICEEAYIRFGMPRPVWSDAHRWRFAMVEIPAGHKAFAAENNTVSVGGDWCLGGKAEAAWTSGEAIAQALIAP